MSHDAEIDALKAAGHWDDRLNMEIFPIISDDHYRRFASELLDFSFKEAPVPELSPEAQAVLDAAAGCHRIGMAGDSEQMEIRRCLDKAAVAYAESLKPPKPVTAYTAVRRGQPWTAETPVYRTPDGWRLMGDEDVWEVEVTFWRKVDR